MRGPALALSLAAVLALPASSSAAVSAGGTGWLWANPLPQGGDLDAVSFVGARGVAAGADGTVLRTDDAGSSWSAAVSRTDADLTEVAMPDANTVYVGGGCVLRRSADGGATFQRVAFAARESRCKAKLAQIAFPTATTGYVILTDGSVLRTANGGRSFARRAHLGVGSSVAQEGASDAVFTTENTGLVSTGLYGPVFLRTEDGGQSWSGITPVDGTGSPTIARVRSLRFLTPLLGYAVSDSAPSPTMSPMAKTEDGGLTWTVLPLAGASGVPRTIDCGDANACVILGSENTSSTFASRLTWTADGGLTGTTFTPTVGLSDAVFASATRVVGVGASGSTLTSDDAGHSFARVGGVLPGLPSALRLSGGQTVFAFGSDGTIARSTSGAGGWQPLGAAPITRLVDVSFLSDTVGYLLSGGGALQRTEDGGASWEVLAGSAPGARALLATARDTLLVAGSSGIRRSTDAGTTFATRLTGRVRAFDRAGTALLAYGAKALLVSGDGGSRWRALRRPPGGGIASADFVSATAGFVVRDDGDVVATTNGGRSWRLLAGVGRDDIAQVSFGDAKHGFLTLSTDSGLGGVLRTSDGGRSWRPQVIGQKPLAQVVAVGPAGGAALTNGLGQLFSTASGGDAGTRSVLTLRVASKHRAGRRTVVTLAGHLKPTPSGAGVSVTARIGGSWVRKFAKVSAHGRFRTTWRLRRGTAFVAQWRGAPGVQGDGTAALNVRVRQHERR
jgi:photosystem II stability/assembly factor-like uncharacterized protein